MLNLQPLHPTAVKRIEHQEPPTAHRAHPGLERKKTRGYDKPYISVQKPSRPVSARLLQAQALSAQQLSQGTGCTMLLRSSKRKSTRTLAEAEAGRSFHPPEADYAPVSRQSHDPQPGKQRTQSPPPPPQKKITTNFNRNMEGHFRLREVAGT